MLYNILFQISLLDKVGYLFLQLKIIFDVMSMVSVELIVLASVSFSEISFDFFRSLNEFLVLDFREYLGDGSIERGKYQFRATRWCTRMPIVGSSPRILIWPLVPSLISIVYSPSI